MKTEKTENLESESPKTNPNTEESDNQISTTLAGVDDSHDSDLLSSVGADLVGSMPAVSEHAIDLEATKAEEFKNQYADLVDKNGTPFDPNIHKTKRDGSPSITKTGKLMLKPASQQKTTTKANQKATTQNSDQPEIDTEQARALGRVSANTLVTMGRMLGGDEWSPIKTGEFDELKNLESAFSDYYIATGKTEMSPTTGLMLAIGSYAMPRAMMPNTKKRIGGFGKRVFAWWHNRKGKKEALARDKAEATRKATEKREA